MHVALFCGMVREEWRNDAYNAIGLSMFDAVSEVPGFVALHKFDCPDGGELAIAYSESEEAMKTWYSHTAHRAVETLGRNEILADYTIEVLELKRSYTRATSLFAATPQDEIAATELKRKHIRTS